MVEEQVIRTIVDKQDSVEVSKNSKGGNRKRQSKGIV